MFGVSPYVDLMATVQFHWARSMQFATEQDAFQWSGRFLVILALFHGFFALSLLRVASDLLGMPGLEALPIKALCFCPFPATAFWLMSSSEYTRGLGARIQSEPITSQHESRRHSNRFVIASLILGAVSLVHLTATTRAGNGT
jgi:hypothetical protein